MLGFGKQMEIGPEKLRKKTCLSVTVTIHFVTVIATAICSTFSANLIVSLAWLIYSYSFS